MKMRSIKIALIGAALLGLLSATPGAQAVVTGQILDFFRVLKVGGTWSGESVVFSTLGVQANGYLNWGVSRGTGGYGVRDNAGTIEIKNSGGSWAAPAGGATPTATYLVRTGSGAPVNAQIMGVLGTGLVINTNGTGVQSIYPGFTCSNTFSRSFSPTGVSSCEKVDLSGDTTGTLSASGFPALNGDVTTTTGSLTTTLAASGVTPASRGSSTLIPTFTVDAKGRLTAAGEVVPQLTLTSTYFSSLSGASLTALPAAQLTGTIAAGPFPALTGDVTTMAGSLATTVASIGGKVVTLGGSLTTSGANALTFTTTGSTNITLPTSGTMVTTAVTSLPSLASVGTLGAGTWQATAVGAQYGGTGLATITAHAVLVGAGTSNAVPVAGCTTGVLSWASASVDPACSGSPIVINAGSTGTRILGGTAIAGAATTLTSLSKVVTGIADASATPVLTATVPNSGQAAVLHVRVVGSLGAGGAIAAFECSSSIEGNITIARTAGVDTVATASTAGMTSNSCVAGATTITIAYSVSGNTGASGASQTFALQVTITKGGGSSANHQALVFAEVLNSQNSGVTIS